jgi:hypothetical protein
MTSTSALISGWDEDRDAFVTAVAELLTAGPHARILTNPPAVLAARDRVVGEVRTLLGVLSQARPEPVPVTVQDVVDRPAAALTGALRLLPTPASFRRVAPSDPPPPHLSEYERRWHEAARRAGLLEQHVNLLRHLPPDATRHALAQLADIAATLTPLDTDLAAACQATPTPQARACLPALTNRIGHAAVRLCATEVRLSTLTPAGNPPQRPEHQEPSERIGLRTHPARLAPRGAQPPAAVLLTDLEAAMATVADAVRERGTALSVPELRAVAALLETGAAHTAHALRRAAPLVPGAQNVADALLPVVEAAAGLRRAPMRSLAPPRVELPALCGELRVQLSRLGALAARLVDTTSAADLHRLAGPALAWASQVQPVTDALAAAVQGGLNAALLAVPTELRTPRGTALLWAPASNSTEPPRVLVRAHDLQESAKPVPHLAQHAAATLNLTTHRAGRSGPAVQAAATAAGAAHTTLSQALHTRASELNGLTHEPLAGRQPRQAGASWLHPR